MLAQMPHIANIEDAVASIEVMRMQEDYGYKTADYMSQAHPEICLCRGPQQQPVDVECRSKMSEWCYQVVDFCKFNRETVAIAMNYLDRFLLTNSGRDALNCRKIFQLAAMTCLYTAVKIHEPEAMEPKVIASLSRGAYTEEEVTAMEQRILTAIDWRMNPPTAVSFAHHFLCLLPEGTMTDAERASALELAKFQTELAVNAYEFVGVNASTVAFASLANAMAYVSLDRVLKFKLLSTIASVACIAVDCDEVMMAQEKLDKAIHDVSPGSTLRPHPTMSKTMGNDLESSSSIHTSPRSVSATN